MDSQHSIARCCSAHSWHVEKSRHVCVAALLHCWNLLQPRSMAVSACPCPGRIHKATRKLALSQTDDSPENSDGLRLQFWWQRKSMKHIRHSRPQLPLPAPDSLPQYCVFYALSVQGRFTFPVVFGWRNFFKNYSEDSGVTPRWLVPGQRLRLIQWVSRVHKTFASI